jgi:hypothetical protein
VVLQIEKIGKDTFDRVVYRFPLCGFPTGSGIVPGLIRGKKSLLVGFVPKFCLNKARVCIVKKEKTNQYNMYRDMVLGKKVEDIIVSKKYDTFIFNNEDTSGLFEVYKVVS